MTNPADLKTILGGMIGRRVIAQEIADSLGISRNAANDRMNRGIDAGDLIAVARHLGINPVEALVELNHLDSTEVFDFVDSDGTLLATAPTEKVIYRLAEDGLSRQDKLRLVGDELESRRRLNESTSNVVQMPYDAVADTSPDEDELRAQEDGDAD